MTITKTAGAGQEAFVFQKKALLSKVLSVGFLYPDAPWKARFDKLLDDVGRELFCRKGEGCGCGIRNLQAFIKKFSLDDLGEEYHRLFSSGGAVSLDAAVYLSDNPFEQAKKVADMAGFYKAFGVDVKEGTRADSLPASFELLSYLWLKAVNAREKGWKEKEKITRDAIGSLSREFLKPALERFSERLAKYSNSGFYQELGNYALKIVKDREVA